MGMSTYVYGIRPPDETWKKMKAVWDACNDAGVDLPQDVRDFFAGDDPHDDGVKVDIDAAEHWDEQGDAIEYEIMVDEIPEGVKSIRFVNSW